MQQDIVIRPLSSYAELAQVEALQNQVWPGSEIDIVPSHLLLAIANNGGVVIGALQQDKIVGYVFGFLGTDQRSPDRVAMARLKHCSHQLGVLEEFQNRGIGYQLKLAQREAVMDQGIRLITWTYDPLMSQNAHLNIRRLGVVCNQYHRDAYGDMRDGLNVGLPSDRFSIEWWVTSSRVVARLRGERGLLSLASYQEIGTKVINPVTFDQSGFPRPPDSWQFYHERFVLVEIPADFQRLRHQDIELARVWRMHTREVFEALFSAGYLVTDFIHVKDDPPRSYYLLSIGEETMG
jgi:predicted GNAT superfamily acetyltransferase